jgi:hypothetical protein
MLGGLAVVATCQAVALVAIGDDPLDQAKHVLMIPTHSFDGLFPVFWHTVISLLRNRAMWRVAPGFMPG